jgi:hypothetical protein
MAAVAGLTGTLQDVDADHNAFVNTPGYDASGVERGGGPANAGFVTVASENDPGEITGERDVESPETDADYRIRVALDHILDRETFNYATQNTGKHSHLFTTLTATSSTNGLLTNSGNGLATATGMTFGTTREWPVGMGAASMYCETNMSLNVAPSAIPSNAVIDVGLFRRGASTAFAPSDGVYFRFSSTGVTAVLNNSGVETVGTPLVPQPNFAAGENHKYTISVTEKECKFWIDDVLYVKVRTPVGNAQAFRSSSLPWSVRHANLGAVGSVLQATITDYTISHGGPAYASTLSQVGNRSLGSYQGLSGGTMGSLANGVVNSTQPTPFVPTNTTAVAGCIAGLGGSCIETDTLAVNTDGIIMSYQIPAGTIAVQGRSLVVTGVRIDSFVQAALTGGGYNDIWFLCFGHTAVSLAQGESASFATATTKAPRRIALGSRPFLAAAAAAGVHLGTLQMSFTHPIYVNPGEFIALARRKVGTAPNPGAIQHVVTLDYGWE